MMRAASRPALRHAHARVARGVQPCRVVIDRDPHLADALNERQTS